jgi:pimeloyl-ACP methyl ester carboxylesterase
MERQDIEVFLTLSRSPLGMVSLPDWVPRLGQPSPLRAWPHVPTRILICRNDRLFPPGFLRRVARERRGITPDEIDGGHTPALSRPHELADRLKAYAAGQGLIPTGRQRPSRPAAGQLARCRT